jgi:hypothetical protein
MHGVASRSESHNQPNERKLVMKGLDDRNCANKVARATQVMALLVLSLLFVLAYTFAAPSTAAAQQSTAEVCRETQKVQDQYMNEYGQVYRTLFVIKHEDSVRTDLSELRSGIANGYIISDLERIASYVGVEAPTSPKERLAFQKTLRPALERELQKAPNSNKDDLVLRRNQLYYQINLRTKRLHELNCEEVLKRESSSADLPNLSGTWTCTIKCPAGGENKTASISQRG